jgi:hypothetical protein
MIKKKQDLASYEKKSDQMGVVLAKNTNPHFISSLTWMVLIFNRFVWLWQAFLLMPFMRHALWNI